MTRGALAILAQADQMLAGWTCDASTECCRFSITGREPSVTQAEWALLEREIARQGRRMPKVPDDDDGRCPFLNTQGRCGVYSARPLGCRTFYCERASGPHKVKPRDLRELARDLDDASDYGAGDRGARPLRSWVRSAAAR
jgi:hypothetical protein